MKKILIAQFPGLGLPQRAPVRIRPYPDDGLFQGFRLPNNNLWPDDQRTAQPDINKGFVSFRTQRWPGYRDFIKGMWFDWYVKDGDTDKMKKWGTGIIVSRVADGPSTDRITFRLQNYTGRAYKYWTEVSGTLDREIESYFFPFVPRTLCSSTPKEYLTNLGYTADQWRDVADNSIESFGDTLTQDVKITGGLASTGGFPFSVLHDGNNTPRTPYFDKIRQRTNLVETLLGDNGAMVGALEDTLIDGNTPSQWVRTQEDTDTWPKYTFKGMTYRQDSSGTSWPLAPQVTSAPRDFFDFHLGNACTLVAINQDANSRVNPSPNPPPSPPYGGVAWAATYDVLEFAYGGEEVALKTEGYAHYLPPSGIGRLVNIYVVDDKDNPWDGAELIFRGYLDDYQSETGEGLVTFQTVDTLQLFKQFRSFPEYEARAVRTIDGEPTYLPRRPGIYKDNSFETALTFEFARTDGSYGAEFLDSQWAFIDGYFFPRQDLVRTAEEDFWPRSQRLNHYCITTSDVVPSTSGPFERKWWSILGNAEGWRILKLGVASQEDSGWEDYSWMALPSSDEMREEGAIDDGILTMYHTGVNTREYDLRTNLTQRDPVSGVRDYAVSKVGDRQSIAIRVGYLSLPSWPTEAQFPIRGHRWVRGRLVGGRLGGRTLVETGVDPPQGVGMWGWDSTGTWDEHVARFQVHHYAYRMFQANINPKKIEPAHVFTPTKENYARMIGEEAWWKATMGEDDDVVQSRHREYIVDIVDVILQVLTSTGTYKSPTSDEFTIRRAARGSGVPTPEHGINGPYDVLPAAFGMGIPLGSIDLEGIEESWFMVPGQRFPSWSLKDMHVRNLYMRLSDTNDIVGWLERNILEPFGLVLVVANGKLRVTSADLLPPPAEWLPPTLEEGGNLLPLEESITTADLSSYRLNSPASVNHRKGTGDMVLNVSQHFIDNSVRYVADYGETGGAAEPLVYYEDMKVDLMAESHNTTPERAVAPNADYSMVVRPVGLPWVSPANFHLYPTGHYFNNPDNSLSELGLPDYVQEQAELLKGFRDAKVTRWGRGKPKMSMVVLPTYRHINRVQPGETLPITLLNAINLRGGKDVIGYVWVTSVVQNVMTGERTVDGYLVAEGVPTEPQVRDLWSMYLTIHDDQDGLSPNQIRLKVDSFGGAGDFARTTGAHFEPEWIVRALDEFGRELVQLRAISYELEALYSDSVVFTFTSIPATLMDFMKAAILAPIDVQEQVGLRINNSFAVEPYSWR